MKKQSLNVDIFVLNPSVNGLSRLVGSSPPTILNVTTCVKGPTNDK